MSPPGQKQLLTDGFGASSLVSWLAPPPSHLGLFLSSVQAGGAGPPVLPGQPAPQRWQGAADGAEAEGGASFRRSGARGGAEPEPWGSGRCRRRPQSNQHRALRRPMRRRRRRGFSGLTLVTLLFDPEDAVTEMLEDFKLFYLMFTFVCSFYGVFALFKLSEMKVSTNCGWPLTCELPCFSCRGPGLRARVCTHHQQTLFWTRVLSLLQSEICQTLLRQNLTQYKLNFYCKKQKKISLNNIWKWIIFVAQKRRAAFVPF